MTKQEDKIIKKIEKIMGALCKVAIKTLYEPPPLYNTTSKNKKGIKNCNNKTTESVY